MSDETKPDLPSTTDEAANSALDVAPEDEGGTALDTIADLVSSLNLPVWVARNASKAFRQLCSAGVEWPAAFFKGKASERQAVTEANTKITEVVTNQIIQQIQVSPEYAQIAVGKHLEKIIGEQLNLDKISAIAANELREDKPNSSTNQSTNEPNQEQSANSINQDTNDGEKETISDVWLNIFEREARPQSTEEGQLLFGRILAGEIRNPGSYSFPTLKTLGELDQNIAALFKKLCSACVILGIQNNEHIIDARVPSLGGNAGSNALKKYGLGFDQLNILNEYRLIISDYNSWRAYNLCIMKQNNPILLPFQYQGKYWILSPTPERDNTSEFRLRGVMLSQVGCELFHIVDQDSMPEYTEDLKKFFEKQNLRMIEVPVL